jgi:superoxide dismutase
MKLNRRQLRKLIFEAFEQSVVNEEEVKKVYNDFKDSYFINYIETTNTSSNLKTLDKLENIIKPYENDKAFLNALGLMWEKKSDFYEKSPEQVASAPNALKVTDAIDRLLNTRVVLKVGKTLQDYPALLALYNENK